MGYMLLMSTYVLSENSSLLCREVAESGAPPLIVSWVSKFRWFKW